MPLSLVNTWGGASSNTYADLDEFETFTDELIDQTPYTGATTPQRAAALVQATRAIDSRNWRGQRYHWNQRLEFPRTQYADGNRFSNDSYLSPIGSPANPEWTRMQEKVRTACCEHAITLLDNDGEDNLLSLQARGVKSYSESIGKISESYSFSGGVKVLTPKAMRLLNEYYEGPRLVRG